MTEPGTPRPFVLLTQDSCPGCARLERMLSGPLRGQFAGLIEVVHRAHTPQRFETLSRDHDVRSTPALLDTRSGDLLRRTESLGEVQAFLRR